MCRLQAKMHIPVLSNITQEAMHVFLPEVLRQMPVCASWNLRQQAGLPLLQQLEDPGRRTQMPLIQVLAHLPHLLIINEQLMPT